MYPGVRFTGKVESLSAANGSTFSLLPPENATGNWVKVTQRFTVRISINPSPLLTQYPLRVGASAEVMVNTR
jgi:membrane fusion protein (multidrug efflux system)